MLTTIPTVAAARYRLVEDAFPLLVSVTPSVFDRETTPDLIRVYEANFAKNRRFALLTYSPPTAGTLTARDRIAIARWANEPRVREETKRWCVASAVIVPGVIERGALTAILWAWSPPQPHRAAATVEDGADFCLAELERAGIPLPETKSELRKRALDAIAALGGS